jgi:hypothetical protein
MPIRINLLAEAQAAEELRRRDPAKRAVFVGIIVIAVVLAWVCVLQAKIIVVNSTLSNRIAQKQSLDKQYTTVVSNEMKLREVTEKLDALNRFTSSRFLEATALDALLRASADGIQVLHLRTEQVYDLVATESKPVSKEKARLVLDVKDSSANPGNEQIYKYKLALAATPYFQSERISTNDIQLRNLSVAQIDTDTGKPYVQFTLECVYPEKDRQ